MAGRGFAPGDNRSRARDEPDKEQLHQASRAIGWDLPEGVLGVLKDGTEDTWHPITRKWWDSWRESPQAQRMLTEPDWLFLLDTALMHHQMWSNGRWDFAAEVRLRVAKFGATPEDRARLKFTIELPDQYEVGDPSVPDNVSRITGRKKRYAAEKKGTDTEPGF